MKWSFDAPPSIGFKLPAAYQTSGGLCVLYLTSLGPFHRALTYTNPCFISQLRLRHQGLPDRWLQEPTRIPSRRRRPRILLPGWTRWFHQNRWVHRWPTQRIQRCRPQGCCCREGCPSCCQVRRCSSRLCSSIRRQGRCCTSLPQIELTVPSPTNTSFVK
jgi:hypothetical protein